MQWPRGVRRIGLKARHVSQTLRDARAGGGRREGRVHLEDVHRRLELLITGLYGHRIPIASAAERPRTFADRVRRRAAEITGRLVAPSNDGVNIFLPSAIRGDGAADAMAKYRLLAIEQAERVRRGTARLATLEDPLERDLYLIRESAAVDGHIAAISPGVEPLLARERLAALAQRPRLSGLTPIEREVELLLREQLAAPAAELPRSPSPEESVVWARMTAEQLRRSGSKYGGVKPAPLWGTVRSADEATAAAPNPWRREESRPIEHIVARKYSFGRTEADSLAASPNSRNLSEKYTERGDSSDGSQGQPDDSATRRQTASRQTKAQPSSLRDGEAPRASAMDVPADRPDLIGLPPAIWYDEWNGDAGVYRKRAAGVRLREPQAGEETSMTSALRENAAIVRKVRKQFERLRAQRTSVDRQYAGDELDLVACVDAIIDRRMGRVPDERLYTSALPARRGLAIALLADVSGSTKVLLGDGRTIIDVEKLALLLAMEALDALGDRYAAYAFAGKSAENVAITPLKTFAEPSGIAVQRRIAALQPSGFTRLGAAVRHTTRELSRQASGHRLLLLLSDGRPNDIDWYQGSYGVEDSRQAILEARASGIFPFCITIDRSASEYLPRIFGTTGHTILQRPEQLPLALLGAVRALIRRP